jgi:hypothetical protein
MAKTKKKNETDVKSSGGPAPPPPNLDGLFRHCSANGIRELLRTFGLTTTADSLGQLNGRGKGLYRAIKDVSFFYFVALSFLFFLDSFSGILSTWRPRKLALLTEKSCSRWSGANRLLFMTSCAHAESNRTPSPTHAKRSRCSRKRQSPSHQSNADRRARSPSAATPTSEQPQSQRTKRRLLNPH